MNTFNSLTPEIQQHLKQIAKTSGMPMTDESWELMATAWLEKKTIFETTLSDNKLVEVAFFGQAEARGALALTWSGSIINIGPLVDGARHCEYTSIGLRADVPPAATEDASVLSSDLEVDERTGVAFYRADIGVDKTDVAQHAGLELVPGMPAEAYVLTGDRNVLSWLMKPITDHAARAMREE